MSSSKCNKTLIVTLHYSYFNKRCTKKQEEGSQESTWAINYVLQAICKFTIMSWLFCFWLFNLTWVIPYIMKLWSQNFLLINRVFCDFIYYNIIYAQIFSFKTNFFFLRKFLNIESINLHWFEHWCIILAYWYCCIDSIQFQHWLALLSTHKESSVAS